ncbi:MAG: glycosyltransferase family 4 protein [Opitutales bacterium]
MKIALITETYPPEVNGVAMTNQRLVRGLIGLGHHILLIKPRRAAAPETQSGQLHVLDCLGLPIPTYPDLKIGLPAPGQLEQAFEQFRPDVVHIATEGPLGFSGLRAARKLGLPATSTFHTNFQDYCADYGAAFAGRIMLGYLRWFHNLCAATTVPDEGLIQRLGEAGLQRLKMLGRGADTELFDPARRSEALRRSWGADPSNPVALYVGRGAAEKNIPLVLETWQKARAAHPGLRMVVVGDGPVRRKLEREWPEVHFAGMRYDADLAAHYASADLFLFASESETFGNVVVEALASGLVVLTYDYAAGRQFIENGTNGFLVEKGDAGAFQTELASILSDRNVWKPVQEAARKTAEAYPWSTTIKTFSKILHEARLMEQSLPQVDTAGLLEDSPPVQIN